MDSGTIELLAARAAMLEEILSRIVEAAQRDKQPVNVTDEGENGKLILSGAILLRFRAAVSVEPLVAYVQAGYEEEDPEGRLHFRMAAEYRVERFGEIISVPPVHDASGLFWIARAAVVDALAARGPALRLVAGRVTPQGAYGGELQELAAKLEREAGG